MLKPDRFSHSQKIWLKQDPPVLHFQIIQHQNSRILSGYSVLDRPNDCSRGTAIWYFHLKLGKYVYSF